MPGGGFAPSAAPQPAFLRALATEAADGRQVLMDLEHAWFAARSTVAGRQRDSHAAAAVDVLAATPLISATTLAAGLNVTVKSAIHLLDGLVTAGIAVEITRRSKRRLFGLEGMAPLGAAVRPPYRPAGGAGLGWTSRSTCRKHRHRHRHRRHLHRLCAGPSIIPPSRRRWNISMRSCGMPGMPCAALRRVRRKGDAGHPGIVGQD